MVFLAVSGFGGLVGFGGHFEEFGEVWSSAGAVLEECWRSAGGVLHTFRVGFARPPGVTVSGFARKLSRGLGSTARRGFRVGIARPHVALT